MGKPGWAKAERLYVEGEVVDATLIRPSYVEVAARFNIPLRTLERRATRQQWPAKRAAFEAEVTKLAGKQAIARQAGEHDIARGNFVFGLRKTVLNCLLE